MTRPLRRSGRRHVRLSCRMRGIILAGGTGSRLWPITQAVSKQLMPVFDKPMIYYPLSTLMMAGIREILIITTPEDQAAVPAAARRRLAVRAATSSTRCRSGPRASPRRSCIGADFIGDDPVALVLGDNIFHGGGLGTAARAERRPRSAAGSSPTRWPTRATYGVVEFDADGRVALHRGEAGQAQVPLRGARPLLLRQPGGRDRPRPQAERPRRAGDHRRQRRLPAARASCR